MTRRRCRGSDGGSHAPSFFFFASAVLLLGGCGQADDPAAGPDQGFFGSYDLAFSSLHGYPATSHHEVRQPSQGLTGRLDIGESDDGVEAVILTDPGDFVERFEVTRGAGELVLTGACANASESAASSSWTDSWCTFRLPVDAKGGLTGVLMAEGTYEFRDVSLSASESAPITAEGTVRPDTTPPAIVFTGVSEHGPRDGVLPWDELWSFVSEGVQAEAFTAHVEARPANAPEGTTSIAPWEPSYRYGSTDEPAWIGARRFWTTQADWTATGHWRHVAVLAGTVPDLRGNQAAIASPELPWLPVGPALDRVEFDATEGLAAWGLTEVLSAASADSCVCEGGSCAALGPADGTPAVPDGVGCSLRTGVAFRVSTSTLGKSLVRLRYRMLLDEFAVNEQSAGAELYVVEVVSPGGERTEHAFPAGFEAAPLGSPCKALTQTTPWRTLDIPVQGATEVGVVVRSVLDSPTAGGCKPTTQGRHLLALEAAESP